MKQQYFYSYYFFLKFVFILRSTMSYARYGTHIQFKCGHMGVYFSIYTPNLEKCTLCREVEIRKIREQRRREANEAWRRKRAAVAKEGRRLAEVARNMLSGGDDRYMGDGDNGVPLDEMNED
jgi:hypothetical protein